MGLEKRTAKWVEIERGGKHTHTHTHGLTLGVKLAVLVPYVGVICVAKGCFLCARRWLGASGLESSNFHLLQYVIRRWTLELTY